MAEPLLVEEVEEFSLVGIMARRDADAAAMSAVLEVEAPTRPRAHFGADMALIGMGPSTWLAFRESYSPFWTEELRMKLGSLASLCDQSSAYALFQLAGPGASTLLKRGASLDFHPAHFPVGSAATTAIAHCNAIIIALDDTPSYHLFVSRSVRRSFKVWIDQAVRTLNLEMS